MKRILLLVCLCLVASCGKSSKDVLEIRNVSTVPIQSEFAGLQFAQSYSSIEIISALQKEFPNYSETIEPKLSEDGSFYSYNLLSLYSGLLFAGERWDFVMVSTDTDNCFYEVFLSKTYSDKQLEYAESTYKYFSDQLQNKYGKANDWSKNDLKWSFWTDNERGVSLQLYDSNHLVLRYYDIDHLANVQSEQEKYIDNQL